MIFFVILQTAEDFQEYELVATLKLTISVDQYRQIMKWIC